MKINQENTTPLNILLADDDLRDCIFFEKALSEIPKATKLRTVKNGERLMKYLQTNEGPRPDVLFLDLSMPVKTGFECLAEIKDSHKLKGINVVMLTASFTRGNDLEDLLKSTLTGMGAMNYIRKTGDIEQLKAVIQQTLDGVIKKAS